MYCGSLFVWEGGRTMEGPPIFVEGVVCRDGVMGEEADSSLLAALARRSYVDSSYVTG